MAETKVTMGGKWSVGYSRTGDITVLRFQCGDQEMEFGLTRGQAESLAQAILYQLDTTPSDLREMN